MKLKVEDIYASLIAEPFCLPMSEIAKLTNEQIVKLYGEATIKRQRQAQGELVVDEDDSQAMAQGFLILARHSKLSQEQIQAEYERIVRETPS